MAKEIKHSAIVTVEVRVTFTITEDEARALDAIAGYGDSAFIDTFYKGCGKAYLQPYESGLRSFLKSIREVVSPALNEADSLRRKSKIPNLRQLRDSI